MDDIKTLLVEDQILTRMGITMAIDGQSGYRIVAEADSVQEAKQQLKRHIDIDVVLLSREQVLEMLKSDTLKQALMLAPLWRYFASNP